MFYKGLQEAAPGVFSGTPPDGAFYAFVKINADWAKNAGITGESLSWAMAEYLIKHAASAACPAWTSAPSCEGYIRFCTCRIARGAYGALASMKETLSRVAPRDKPRRCALERTLQGVDQAREHEPRHRQRRSP